MVDTVTPLALPAPTPNLYDAENRCFDPVLLRRAMVMRRLTRADLARLARVSKTTVNWACRGGAVLERTAIAILSVLERETPMEVVA